MEPAAYWAAVMDTVKAPEDKKKVADAQARATATRREMASVSAQIKAVSVC